MDRTIDWLTILWLNRNWFLEYNNNLIFSKIVFNILTFIYVNSIWIKEAWRYRCLWEPTFD